MPRCDFCFSQPVRWIFSAARILVAYPGKLVRDEHPLWAACDACEKVISGGCDAEKLFRHSWNRSWIPESPEIDKAVFDTARPTQVSMYEAFLRTRGKARPADPSWASSPLPGSVINRKAVPATSIDIFEGTSSEATARKNGIVVGEKKEQERFLEGLVSEYQKKIEDGDNVVS